MLKTLVLILFAGGMALSPYLNGSLALFVWLVFAGALLVIAAYCPISARVFNRFWRDALTGLLACVVGVAFGVNQLERQLAKTLPSALDKQKIVATLKLEYQLSAEPQRSVWRARLESIQCANEPCDRWYVWLEAAEQEPIRFAWYGKAELQPGEVWQLALTLRRPRGFVNPKGFDYAAWLLQQGFVATGYSSDKAAKRITTTGLSASWVRRLNQTLARRLEEGLAPNSPSATFFEGLLLGRRDRVSADDWQILQRTGTNHLFAISGLHIGLVALLGFAVVRAILRVLRAPLPWPVQRHLPVAGAVVLAVLYALVSGLSLPTQRALVVVVLAALASALSVQLSLWRLWAWALVVVLVAQPLASTSIGFWLSFLAVAVLLWFFAGRSARATSVKARCLALLKAQFALAIGLALPLWWLGLPVSLTGPWVNLIAVPLVSAVIVPGLLLWVPLQLTPLGDYWLQLLAGVFDVLWAALAAIGQWDASLQLPFEHGLRHFALALLWGLAAAALLAPRALHARFGAACILALVLVANWQSLRADKDFELVVLDVGQGLAVVLQRGEHALVFDTGMAFSPSFNAGSHIITPYLTSHGLTLDALVVSHGDLDHKGGAAALYERFTPKAVFAGQRIELGLPATACSEQPPWQWRGVSLRFLWPPAEGADSAGRLNDNNRSCVLLVEFGNTRFLLPGDIEAVAEAKLVAAGLAPVDVLVAPHHGSKTSSSQAFVDALRPSHVVVSAGFKSRYGHPHSIVLKRFEQLHAQIWTTAQHGAVRFRSDGENINVDSHREQLARRWFAQ